MVAARKPFNKQRYFKQKTFEESIISSYCEEDTRMSAADSSMTTTPKYVFNGGDEPEPRERDLF